MKKHFLGSLVLLSIIAYFSTTSTPLSSDKTDHQNILGTWTDPDSLEHTQISFLWDGRFIFKQQLDDDEDLNQRMTLTYHINQTCELQTIHFDEDKNLEMIFEYIDSDTLKIAVHRNKQATLKEKLLLLEKGTIFKLVS